MLYVETKNEEKEPIKIEPCPICHQKASVGQLKANRSRRFYCSLCFCEFVIQENGIVKIYEIDDKGKNIVKVIKPRE